MLNPVRAALALTLAVLLTSAAGAQQEGVEKQDSQARFKALEKGFSADMKKAREEEVQKAKAAQDAIEKAKREGKPIPAMPAMRMGPPTKLIAKHLKGFEKAAADYQGSDEAIPFLGWIVTMGGFAGAKDRVGVAFETLATTHAKSPKIAEALRAISYAGRMVGQEEVDRVLRKIEAENPLPEVKAKAILARINQDLQNAPVGSPLYAEAKAEALRAAKISESKSIRLRVKHEIAGREDLVAGKIASDIEGVDLDGKAFKLSDYKGRIIMLDFWGDW